MSTLKYSVYVIVWVADHQGYIYIGQTGLPLNVRTGSTCERYFAQSELLRQFHEKHPAAIKYGPTVIARFATRAMARDYESFLIRKYSSVKKDRSLNTYGKNDPPICR